MKGYLYRIIMRVAHKYNWHYAPPIFPENDIQLWCKWCGFRETYDGKRYKWVAGKGVVIRADVVEKEMRGAISKAKS